MTVAAVLHSDAAEARTCAARAACTSSTSPAGRRESIAAMSKLSLYYGTVKSATSGRHIMAWANSRNALDLVRSRAHGN